MEVGEAVNPHIPEMVRERLAMERGSDLLLRALMREHPRILAHLLAPKK